MNRLIETQQLLLEVTQLIEKLARKGIQESSPDLWMPEITSLEKRRVDLEEQFLREANIAGVDVCSYQIVPAKEALRITTIAEVLSRFQYLVTIVYDALKNAPKRRARISPEVWDETEFGFGYTFPGSVGFALTLPNERRLMGDSTLDVALDRIFAMAKAQTSEQVREFSFVVGQAGIRALHRWADVHVKRQLSANIQWRREDHLFSNLRIQDPELELLKEAIEQTSDTSREEIVVQGDLVAADVKKQSFKVEVETPDGTQVLQGSFRDAISETHTVELPQGYEVTLEKSTQFFHATGEELVEYFLSDLKPI